MKNKLLSQYLVCIFFLIAILFGFYIEHVGLDLSDETYQITNSFNFSDTAQAPLAAFLGMFIGEATHWKLLGFRYFTWSLICLTFILVSIFLSKRLHNFIEPVMACSVSLFLYSLVGALREYGWDVYSLFFTTLCLLILLYYLLCRDSKSYIYAIGLGLLSAITTLVRLPNLIIIPILSFLFFFKAVYITDAQNGYIKGLRITAVYLVSSAIGLLAILWILYGQPFVIIEIFFNKTMGAHGYREIVYSWIAPFSKYLQYGIISFYTLLLIRKSEGKRMMLLFLSVVLVIEMSLFIYFTDYLDAPKRYLYVIVGIVWLVYIIVCRLHERDREKSLIAVSIFLLCMVPAFGSNTGFSKYMALVSIPLSMIALNKGDLSAFKYFLVPSLMVLSVFMFWANLRSSFNDGGIRDCKSTINIEKLDNIKTTEYRAHLLNGFISKIDSLKSIYKLDDNYNNLLIVGDKTDRYILEYLFERPNQYLLHSWDYKENFEDSNYTEFVKGQAKPGTFIVIWGYEDNGSFKNTLMFEEISKITDPKCLTQKYAIFVVPHVQY